MNEEDMRKGIDIAISASQHMDRVVAIDVFMALYQDFLKNKPNPENSVVYEGTPEYENSGNGSFSEWAYVDGITFIHMLDELYRKDDWQFTSKPRKVRVTIERLD